MALTFQQLLTAVPLVLRAGNVPDIVGDAGVGKSALVERVAQKTGAALFTTVVSLSEKGDLAIPVPPLTSDSFVETKEHGRLANVQFGYSETLVQIIKHAELHPDQPIIWFLDEFNRGTQAVQSELMNLVLQRRINALALPDQVRIIIAENPDSTMAGFANREYDVAVADAAIKDRTVRLVMQASTSEWLAWAAKRQPPINPLVTAYLTKHPDRLTVVDDTADLTPTPRAWERVSTNLDQLQQLPVSTQKELAADLFCGDLGGEVGTSFTEFVLAQGSELTLTAIRSGNGGAAFADAGEAQKVALLREWVQTAPQSLASGPDAEIFMERLRAISPDGQAAVAQSVGEAGEQALAAMYAAASAAPDEGVAHLYRYLAKVAAKGDNY